LSFQLLFSSHAPIHPIPGSCDPIPTGVDGRHPFFPLFCPSFFRTPLDLFHPRNTETLPTKTHAVASSSSLVFFSNLSFPVQPFKPSFSFSPFLHISLMGQFSLPYN